MSPTKSKKQNWRKLPLIMVEWNDTSGTASWATEKQAKESEVILCKTVGWRLKTTGKKLIMAASCNTTGDYADRSTIPKGCIKSIRRIE